MSVNNIYEENYSGQKIQTLDGQYTFVTPDLSIFSDKLFGTWNNLKYYYIDKPIPNENKINLRFDISEEFLKLSSSNQSPIMRSEELLIECFENGTPKLYYYFYDDVGSFLDYKEVPIRFGMVYCKVLAKKVSGTNGKNIGVYEKFIFGFDLVRKTYFFSNAEPAKKFGYYNVFDKS